MENQFDDKQLKIFLHQMTKKEVGLECLLTGSSVEIGKADFFDHPSDVDMMCSMSNILGMAVEDDEKDVVPRSFNGRLIKHFQNHPDCHPGFSRIESRDHAFVGKLFTDRDLFVKGNGPAMKLGNMWKKELAYVNVGEIKDPDIVYSIPCQGWPSTASAWKTRHRISDWPSEDLIRDAVTGGYHLVDKPHPRHPKNENFWRISFSRSECLLMRSMNEVQKRVYALLRKIKNLIVQNSKRENIAPGSVLSTYFFKTALFWFCEEKPKEFWEYENVPIAVKEIIGKLVVWFIEKSCPNYFIPENNMLDHLGDDVDLDGDITSLVRFAEYDWSDIETQLMNMQRDRMSDWSMGFGFAMMPKEWNAFKETCDFKREVPSLLQMLESVFSALMNSEYSKDAALDLHSSTHNTYTDLNILFGRTIDFFGPTTEIQPLSSSRSEHRNTATDARPGSQVDLFALFKPTSYDIQELSVLYRSLRQWDLDTSGNSVDSIVSECHVPSINTRQNKRGDIELLKIIGDLNSDSDNSLLEAQSRTDAINRSLTNIKTENIFDLRRTTFVICTYLTNYYYAAEKDYSSAMLLGNTLIDACASNLFYYLFSELSYPILLSSRWSRLFDDNFRAVYGLLVLFNSISAHDQYSLKVLDAQPSVKFCPILFLRYIKVQLEMKCGDDFKVERAVQDFFWHMENRCAVDGHKWTVTEGLSRRILLAVLRSSLAAANKLWMLENRNYPAPNIHKKELPPPNILSRVIDHLL